MPKPKKKPKQTELKDFEETHLPKWAEDFEDIAKEFEE